MTLVRVGLAEGFYFGEDAVLLALDTDGVSTYLAALTQAEQVGASRLDLDGTIHEFLIEGSAADIEFHDEDDTVVWRLGGAKAQEVIELLTDMSQHPGKGHYYVDMSTPAETLVISLGEYV
ncbi:hypothetical protein ACTXG5_14690 [Mycobacterium sp. Dal123C01]|uniref:hypothetical protein n=1 Tax=Mycobacterium sp. Dal123C01 TaxID=3457577 RepID=UPI00403EEB9E